MTSAITASGLRKSFGDKVVPRLLWRHHRPPFLTPSGTGERATMSISQSQPAIAVTGLQRLASAIERAAGDDTGSEGASR